MKIQKSPITLLEILLLNLNYQFSADEDIEQAEIYSLMNNYSIDIDFVRQNSSLNDKDIVRVFMKIDINTGKSKVSGYSISIEGVGIFSFVEGVDENTKVQLINYSAISMVMNYLRGVISNVTGYGLLGRYTLPPIDVNHLLKEKSKISENDSNKSKKVKKFK